MNKITILVFSLMLCMPLTAQTLIGDGRPDGNSTLFRGNFPKVYPFKYNGTYFWGGKDFQEGRVFYNGKLYDHVLLNVDAYAAQLLASPSGNSAVMVLFRDQVAWFTMGDATFVNLRYLGYSEAEEGFYEVVRDGRIPLLRLVKKILDSDTNNHNGAEIGYMDPDYDKSVIQYFAFKERFYAIEEGRLVPIKKRAFKKFLKQEGGEPSLLASGVSWHPESEKALPGKIDEASFPVSRIELPADYFNENAADSSDVNYSGKAVTATYRNKFYSIGSESLRKPGLQTVMGTVMDNETEEPLYGVVVFDSKTSTYVRTDSKGRYRIQLPDGDNVLNFSYESKEDLALQVRILSGGSFDVVLSEKVTMLKESVVSAESMANHRVAAIGLEKIGVKTLKKIPTAFGEGDVLKAVLSLPGVKSVGEASAGFNVRGGSADQNLILFNESTVYNPTHMFGIFSSFNPDVVDGVELYKSSIPAEYGGRVSSVLNVKSKDGDMQTWGGSAGIGILTSRLKIEGPLAKDKTSLVLGARTTYSDWILRMLPKNSAYSGGSAGFSDANIGLTHHFDSDNTIQAYGYFAKDRFSFGSDTTFNYTSANASLVFKHKTDDGGHFKISTGYDHFNSSVGFDAWEEGAYDITTVIRQAFFKGQRVRPVGEEHSLSYGTHLVGYSLDPGIQNPHGVSRVQSRSLEREYALEPSLFVSDNWMLSDRFSLESGVRLSGFYAGRSDSFYGGPELRLSGKYSLSDNFSLKGGFNTMRQYIHLISNTTSISPMDTWKLTDADIKQTSGWQAAAGAYWTHLGTGIDLSLETYYKGTSNHLDYKPGAVLVMNQDLAEDLVPVRAKSYGVELMARKTTGRLTGWISYGYSRTKFREMQDRGGETIAGGKWYNAPYDKPHEFKFVSNFELTHRYSFSVNVDYSTGRPITVPIGTYYLGRTWRLAYSERNAYRIPDYFRTDVAFNIDPGHSLFSLVHATVTLGVYNVTGRKNPYSVYFDTDPHGSLNGYLLSVFATQIPYINLNLLF